LVVYADPARGTFRYASLVGTRLDAALFIARTRSGLPSRDGLAALLGTRIENRGRAFILSGSVPGAALPEFGGRTICACFGVGLKTLHNAIAARRLTTVAEIGANLRAGTNCGSCIPELKAILNSSAKEPATVA
jgi:assimilatory nitrate reductase catalytic subunit